MNSIKTLLLPLSLFLLFNSCSNPKTPIHKIPILIDTDANNELDDQHALAYLFFNGGTFDVAGVTVNATQNGGNVSQHYNEARRVMQLCKVFDKIPLLSGANDSFSIIRPHVRDSVFDGSDAVNFIIKEAHTKRDQKLVLVPVGKLTNIALALAKDSSIIPNIRIVWLGSNYPESGEYNLENDIEAMNFILSLDVPFEMVTVRYGKTTGSGNVSVTREEIEKAMPGKGPEVEAVEGRHGGSFTCFGDYSVNLFENCEYYGDPPSRSLYDMTAVAIVKNPAFGQSVLIPAPAYENGKWELIPGNTRMIRIWENFDRNAILKDFYESMDSYQLPN
ncbi:MAG: nucleoside hydrolase [Bacteroidales bacterium]|nr:nucleoside hydrolase [Bacteroidales bacterium]MCB8998563.1 nucleoside hydrolase [Bacteroidales bacterium]MCB9012569.1 nucleoside hydrolase [Bacteroidales bacterium]